METPRKKKAAPAVEPKLPKSIADKVEKAARESDETRAAALAPLAGKTIKIKVRRQDEADKRESIRDEVFEVELDPAMTVHGALAAIQRKPITVEGKSVAPPVWEASCLAESCGACTMLIDGQVRQACSTRLAEISPKQKTVVLEPLSKFRVLRDLIVDRSRLFETFAAVSGWVSLEPVFASGGAGPRSETNDGDDGAREGHEDRALRLSLAECIGCGACLEACPEFGPRRPFVGAAAINVARLMNLHPTGKFDRRARLDSLMGAGGVADCGKAQNCVEVCPKSIPLVESIASVARDTTKQMIFDWILG